MSLSAVESERYDRQIRLWGVEAQSRMQRTQVLVCGLRGLHVETVKNLVLAGVGVTLLDHARVEASDLQYNFFLTAHDVGLNVWTMFRVVLHRLCFVATND